MAFTVTPTSGEAPYVFNVTFADKNSIDGVNYGVEFRAMSNVGSCLADGLAGNSSVVVAGALLNNGTYTATQTLASGSCRTSTLLIRNLATNAVVSTMSVTVDNV